MRWNILVALGLIASSLVAVGVVACSDSTTCKTGTLLLQVGLLDTAPLADTISISIADSGAELTTSFPHTPNSDAANVGVEHINLELTWPQGYPTGKLVHVVVKATGGTTVLGSNSASIHLDDKCTVGNVAISGRTLPPPDMAGSD
jgi:hypothetical protein